MIVEKASDKHLLLKQVSFSEIALLDSFPGFTKWKGRELLVRSNGVNLDYIRDTWPDAEWSNEAKQVLKDYFASLEKSVEVASIDDFKFHRSPFGHQLKALSLSAGKEAFGFFMEQGTGKTKLVLDEANFYHSQNLIDVLVVISWPFGIHMNWINYEVPQDLKEGCFEAMYWPTNHSTKKMSKALDFFAKKRTPKLRVIAFSIESLKSVAARSYLVSLVKSLRCYVCIDQSASIKNPNSNRTKFLIKEISSYAKFRRILDGNPVAEGADEFFSQFRFLNPNIVGHDTWTGFKAEYCRTKPVRNGKGEYIVGYKNLDRLKTKISPFCFRVRTDECQDLPDRIYKRYPFELNGQERRAYDEMNKRQLATFEGEQSIAKTALVKVARLQQISAGWFPVDQEPMPLGESRFEALKNLISSFSKNEKFLIFSRFRADIEKIVSLFPGVVGYYGDIDKNQRERNKSEFLNNPEIKGIAGTPSVLGIGHTLTVARHVIFYVNHHSLRFREESEKRAHRQGQREKVFVWDLVAEKTLDSKIVDCLKRKKSLSNELLEDPDNFFLDYE